MAEQLRWEIIKENPIEGRLDTFRTAFNNVCDEQGLPRSADALDQMGVESILSCPFSKYFLKTAKKSSISHSF